MAEQGRTTMDWRADAYGRLTTVVGELDTFRSSLRSWITEVQAVDVVGSAEHGKVLARCSGHGELKGIEIDRDFYADADTRRLERAITTAVSAAEKSAREELTARQSELKIFGVSVAAGLAGKPITELLPPPGALPHTSPSTATSEPDAQGGGAA